jgi:hypothetical protein
MRRVEESIEESDRHVDCITLQRGMMASTGTTGPVRYLTSYGLLGLLGLLGTLIIYYP